MKQLFDVFTCVLAIVRDCGRSNLFGYLDISVEMKGTLVYCHISYCSLIYSWKYQLIDIIISSSSKRQNGAVICFSIPSQPRHSNLFYAFWPKLHLFADWHEIVSGIVWMLFFSKIFKPAEHTACILFWIPKRQAISADTSSVSIIDEQPFAFASRNFENKESWLKLYK